METPPPRWVRRLFLAPLVFFLALGLVVLSPVIHLFAAILDVIFDRRRFRLSRFVGIGLAYCLVEVFGLFALLTVWVGSGFGWFMARPLWVRANWVLCGQFMEMLTRATRFFLGFGFHYTQEPVPPGPQLLFCRHAGPGDAFLILRLFMRDTDRNIVAVGASKLRWDPFLDIAGERLGFHYLNQNPKDGHAELENIRRMAAALGPRDTLLIFPEGGNITPSRRRHQIEHFEATGRTEKVERARHLHHTLLPRAGGVLAALDGCPDASVVFAGHAGLDQLFSFADIWGSVPLHRQVVAQGWAASLDGVDAGVASRTEWLYDQWQVVDDWIDSHLPQTGISPSSSPAVELRD